ncbi:palmitoyl-monogalactosyldiacylglycerol delta-7 desaturase, chloroplastic-like [Argentina anserina]|uniref:palmitoyl-monogalactosyldiacylglycerol delta-7 desaturase, chloroplastic-like n=1 Tax=Argentina anserina TaxID=57926 RepID=UPI0021765DA1|nr:palmitoyl-monogalactosyldiacylglycerol delta-7 desaturase, chloroplastic-like [Potentilla anserina]
MVDWRVTSLVKFLGREWNFIDVLTLIIVTSIHCLALLAPFQFTWGAFSLFVALYFLTGLGITLGYHRNLAHRSLKLQKWLEYFFAYCGVLTLQGSPIEWVSTHRYHHQYTDTKKDPHSPIKGLWFSHIGWIFNHRLRFESYSMRLKNADDLRRQAYYRFIHRTYLLHPVALGVLFYALGGLPYLVWGTGVRTVVGFHVTFSVNSVGHIWGKRVWDTGDLSRNNWLLALPTLGEGWHNNHHAFDYSARQGLEWWQIDLTWYFIRFLQVAGLATDVKTPTETQKNRKPLYNNTTAQKCE